MDKLLHPCRLQGTLLTNATLANYTSWRVGGNADYLYKPAHLTDLITLLQHLRSPTIPITWLGLGSNTLVRDRGVPGLVILTQGTINQFEQQDTLLIKAGVGLSSAQLARRTARLGLSGLEFMAGIPGTLGGALAMNAGCYGGETWHFIQQVEMIDRDGTLQVYPASAFKVTYRTVCYPMTGWFIAGYFKLLPVQADTALHHIRLLLEKRNHAQPMGTINCGSVFRNPPNHYAAKLIEQAGLKGKTIGGAVVSEKHANFIINQKNATATDIEHLIKEIQSIVYQQTGIQLINEVCIIGRC